MNESIKLPKASQLFEACIDTRRVLIAGGAAHQKNEVASRLAAILACKEFDYTSISQIPHHVIKTAGCLQTLEDFTKVCYYFVMLEKKFSKSDLWFLGF